MNLGKKLSLGAITMGLSFGALALGGSGCGSTQATKASEKACGAGSCGADKKPAAGGEKASGGEKGDGSTEGGGEHTCGAGACGK